MSTASFPSEEVRNMLLAEAEMPQVIAFSRRLGFNYPLYLLIQMLELWGAPEGFTDPVVDLLIDETKELGFWRIDDRLDTAVRFAKWSGLKNQQSLLIRCLEKGTVLAVVSMLEKTKFCLGRDDLLKLASKINDAFDSESLCRFVQNHHPDLLDEVKRKRDKTLENKEANDIPF